MPRPMSRREGGLDKWSKPPEESEKEVDVKNKRSEPTSIEEFPSAKAESPIKRKIYELVEGLKGIKDEKILISRLEVIKDRVNEGWPSKKYDLELLRVHLRRSMTDFANIRENTGAIKSIAGLIEIISDKIEILEPFDYKDKPWD